MKLESPAFAHGASIPRRHTCDGEDESPELRWEEPPPETRSFALFVVDPDAPKGTFTHWVLYDLAATLQRLPERAANVGVSGRNDFQRDGWGGPCPPRGHGEHRYFFRLYALDIPTLELTPGATRSEVEERIQGHVLAEAELMGRYRRD